MFDWVKRVFARDGDKIVGHKTFRSADGFGFRHEPLTKREGDALWRKAESDQRQQYWSITSHSMAGNPVGIHGEWRDVPIETDR